MDKILDLLILDETPKVISSSPETTSELINYLPTTSINYALQPSGIDSSLNEKNGDEIYTISDSLKRYQNTSTPNQNCKHRIHLGTQPGFYKKGDITFSECQKLHSKVIDALEAFLISINVEYEFIKRDVFSTGEWGLEPYACILFSCSDETARGLAATIGFALKQDAIGIFIDNGDGFSHPVYTVSTLDDSLITKTDALILMKQICERCPWLSAQFDQNGQNLEFHDFENTKNEPTFIQVLESVINEYFGKGNFFLVKASVGQSDLLQKDDYRGAIKLAGFEPYGKLIELIFLHSLSYKKPEVL